ncbi:uncharacterized protein LOC114132101 isoform X2 [Aphis gossypii]|uniref:uncharacterized protein LOC114132101 isoform X2 n=1 Tax=Aphis gossypii TaxID=80765 RepID=UPI002159914B|nr:uncharacterized protein LOC114132101 isoform X2 [Aphis gossypii]
MTSISETNDKTSTRKHNPTDDEDVTFFFFYDLVKQLILKRNDIGDASVLSSWLKVLEQNKNKTVRNEYIKLMTLALQYTDPICPFKDPPPDTIDPLENGVIEMAKKFLNKEGTATCIGDNEYDIAETYPTISTAMSNNKCQYASYQVIPNVGVQCYYAFSDEPMYNWSLSSKIKIPKSGPHATDVEWERALAGIKLQLVTLSTDNLKPPNAPKNITVKDDVSEIKRSVVSGNSRVSKKKSDRLKESEKTSVVCNVMNIEQQNRNISEVFVWNDASLLTGEMRLGAEECSDRKIDTQVKTQTELDKIAFNAYDILYPGDFMIKVVQSVINDIIPTKTNDVTETDDKKKQQQPSAQDDGGGHDGCTIKNQHECSQSYATRQSAGHGNVNTSSEERLTAFDESPSDRSRIQRMSKPIRRPSALNATDFCTGGNHNRGKVRNATDDCKVVFSGHLGRCNDDRFTGGETRPADRRSKGQSFRAYPENLPASVSSLTDPKCVRLLAQQLYVGRSLKSRDGNYESD